MVHHACVISVQEVRNKSLGKMQRLECLGLLLSPSQKKLLQFQAIKQGCYSSQEISAVSLFRTPTSDEEKQAKFSDRTFRSKESVGLDKKPDPKVRSVDRKSSFGRSERDTREQNFERHSQQKTLKCPTEWPCFCCCSCCYCCC